MTCTCIHKDQCSTTIPRQWGPYQVYTAKLEASFGAISPIVDLHGWKKHSGKADQLTLVSGGSEHA